MLPMSTRLRNPRRSLVSSPISVPVGSYQPWSPLALQPTLWFDASDAATITSSSGSVSEWKDKSGNGRHASQATSTNQPKTGVDTKNGLNVLSFTASSTHHLVTPAGSGYIVLDRGLSLFIVSRSTTNTVVQQSLSQKDGTGIGRYFQQFLNTPNLIQSLVGGNVATAVSVTYANNWYLFCVQMPSGSGQVRVADVNNNLASASATSGSDAGTGEFVIGASKLISNPLQGQIAEIIVCPNLNSSHVSQVRNYLNAKWAVY